MQSHLGWRKGKQWRAPVHFLCPLLFVCIFSNFPNPWNTDLIHPNKLNDTEMDVILPWEYRSRPGEQRTGRGGWRTLRATEELWYGGGLMMHVVSCTRSAQLPVKKVVKKAVCLDTKQREQQETYLHPAGPGGVCRFCKSFVSGTQRAPTLHLSHPREIYSSLRETRTGKTSRTW